MHYVKFMSPTLYYLPSLHLMLLLLESGIWGWAALAGTHKTHIIFKGAMSTQTSSTTILWWSPSTLKYWKKHLSAWTLEDLQMKFLLHFKSKSNRSTYIIEKKFGKILKAPSFSALFNGAIIVSIQLIFFISFVCPKLYVRGLKLWLRGPCIAPPSLEFEALI